MFEPRPGGRVFERAANGVEYEWGEVLDWAPPTRVRYLWHLFFDRSEATEVELTFTVVPDGTQIRLEHRGWERLGDVGPPRRSTHRPGLGRADPVVPGGSDQRLEQQADRVDDDSRKRADDGAVDPDELQVAADLQLDLARGLLRIPTLDGFGDRSGQLVAIVRDDVDSGVLDPAVDLGSQISVIDEAAGQS